MKLGDAMKKEEQQYSKIQWFFLVIFIPVVFAIILFSIILSLMGVNVIDQTKQVASNVPILSEYVQTEEQILEEEEKANIEELTAKLNQREIEISRLETTISRNEEEIESLLEEIGLLMLQLEELQDAQFEVFTEYEEIGKLYEAMAAQNAARIISELPDEKAAIHLSFMNTETKAAILAQLPAEKAAQLISLISNN